jgi:hypothetical protein
MRVAHPTTRHLEKTMRLNFVKVIAEALRKRPLNQVASVTPGEYARPLIQKGRAHNPSYRIAISALICVKAALGSD